MERKTGGDYLASYPPGFRGPSSAQPPARAPGSLDAQEDPGHNVQSHKSPAEPVPCLHILILALISLL